MSYFAELDEDNLVLQVIVADQDFVSKLPGRWVPTCTHGKASKNYAGIGQQFNSKSKEFLNCSLERIFLIEPAKDSNGKQLYYKKAIGTNKQDLKKIPLKQKTYYLWCKKRQKRIKSNKPPEIIYPEIE